jgi:soluble lytic murein transglycosylase-like protein
MRTAIAVLLAVGQHAAAGPDALAARGAVNVAIPLRLPLQKIERDIKEQLFNSPEGTCVLVADEAVCRRFYLSRPQVSSRGKFLRITCDAVALYGGAGGPACTDPQRWQGQAELTVQPLIAAAGRRLTFKVAETSFSEKDRRTVSVPDMGDSAHRLIVERFEKATIDCAPLVDRIAGLLAVLLPGGRERAEQALGSLSISPPQVYKFSLAMKLSLAIEPLPSDQKPFAAMVRERREERLKRWDAFVTFVSKRLGRNRQQEQQRNVAGVLLDARYDLAAAPEGPERAPSDPVPGLFVRTWKRMRPVALGLSRESTTGPGPDLENFITAGSVIAALSAQEKALNYQVSDDGMRAVARLADPEYAEDPLAYSTEVDPELRSLFGFGDPLPQPVISPAVTITRGLPENRNRLRFSEFMPERWFLALACAAEEADAFGKLNSWVPLKSELTAYLEMVRTLLVELREETLAKRPLADPYALVYRDLVLATAWQESCWRQFIRTGDAITPLVSSANSVGLMQVNPRVWRGVYDVEGLYGDIRYNGRAGCEILLHYLRDYAIAKGEDKLAGGIDNLPRAAYAIYNGGPGHRTRYRTATTSAALKKIDASLWQKYAAVREGKEMEVAGCYR